MIDAFLELKDFSGKLVEGESNDSAFPKRIEVYEFSLGDGRAQGDDDDPTAAAAQGAKAADKKIDELIKTLNGLKAKTHESATKDTVNTALRDADGVKALISQMDKDLKAAQTKAGMKVEPEPEPPKPGAGKKAADQLTFSIGKDFDSASPDLFQAYCWTQAPREAREEHKKIGRFQSATVTLRKMCEGKPVPYLVCSFGTVEVWEYSVKFDSGRNGLVEDVSFRFVEYKVWYRAQTDDGSKGADASAEGTTAQTKDK